MTLLWLDILSLRDQGISGNVWVWAGVRSHAVGIPPISFKVPQALKKDFWLREAWVGVPTAVGSF